MATAAGDGLTFHTMPTARASFGIASSKMPAVAADNPEATRTVGELRTSRRALGRKLGQIIGHEPARRRRRAHYISEFRICFRKAR